MSGLFVGGSGGGALAGDVTGPQNANTVVQITGSAGTAALLAATLLFGAAVASPTMKQTAPSSDVAPQNLTLSAQAPNAGATVNKDAGDVIINTPLSVGGSVAKFGGFQVQLGGSSVAALGTWRNSASQGALWLGGGTAPLQNTFSLFSDGSNTYVNAPAGAATIFFFTANTTQLGSWTTSLLSVATALASTRATAATAGDIRGPKDFTVFVRNAANTANLKLAAYDGSNNAQFGDAANGSTTVNAGTEVDIIATSNVAIECGGTMFLDGSTILFRDSGHASTLNLSLNSGGATTLTVQPTATFTLTQAIATAATAVDMTISAQTAKVGSGANGGNLNLSAGAPDLPTGVFGRVRLQSNSITALAVGAIGMELAVQTVAIVTGSTTLSAAQYAAPHLVMTGAIGGGTANVVFPNTPGLWTVDLSQVSGAASGVVFKSGTATAASITTPVAGTKQVFTVSTLRGANTIAVG